MNFPLTALAQLEIQIGNSLCRTKKQMKHIHNVSWDLERFLKAKEQYEFHMRQSPI